MLTFRLADAGRALDALEGSVLDAIEDAVNRAGDVVAHDARADHPYQDRTGDLTASIEALPAVRTADGARGGVLAGEDYASFVEARGFAFLAPAAERSGGRVELELDRALEDAVRRGSG